MTITIEEFKSAGMKPKWYCFRAKGSSFEEIAHMRTWLDNREKKEPKYSFERKFAYEILRNKNGMTIGYNLYFKDLEEFLIFKLSI